MKCGSEISGAFPVLHIFGNFIFFPVLQSIIVIQINFIVLLPYGMHPVLCVLANVEASSD